MNPDLVPDGWRWRPKAKRKPSGSWRTNLIRRIAAVDGWRCRFCDRVLVLHGEEQHRATLDHWVPRSRGGRNTFLNYVLACLPCNLAKANQTGEEFLAIPPEERERLRLVHLMKPHLEETDE